MRGKGVPASLRGVGGMHGNQGEKGKGKKVLPPAQTVRLISQEATVEVEPGDLQGFQKRIGIIFRNQKLLQRAFVHRSYLNENPRADLENNERLEFLGDKVLGFALGQYLFRRLPDAPEGKMTAIFGHLASADTLQQIGEELGIDKLILLSRGEKQDVDARKRSRRFILADTVEALIGAIYLDHGAGMVEIFLDSFLFPKLKDVIEKWKYLDPKSYFQDQAQAAVGITPHYRVLEESGPHHDRRFLVGVFVENRCAGQGSGVNKKKAESEAARDALKKDFGIELPQ